MSGWPVGIAPAEIAVRCGEDLHRIRWDQGRLVACDHGDLDEELALAALGGEPFECIELVRAWGRHRHNLRVLVIGPRGGSDELRLDPDDAPAGGTRLARVPGGRGSRRHSVLRLGAAGGRARSRSSSGPGPGPGPDRGSGSETDDLRDVIALAALGGSLGERLVATVAAEWSARLRDGDVAVAGALPRLDAALYGRVFAGLRSWLGEPRLSLQLEMVDAGAPRTLARIDGVVRAALPFEWLVEVWARDLQTVNGRFCLSAATADGRDWQLHTIAPDLRTTERIELRLGPDPEG